MWMEKRIKPMLQKILTNFLFIWHLSHRPSIIPFMSFGSPPAFFPLSPALSTNLPLAPTASTSKWCLLLWMGPCSLWPLCWVKGHSFWASKLNLQRQFQEHFYRWRFPSLLQVLQDKPMSELFLGCKIHSKQKRDRLAFLELILLVVKLETACMT